MQRLINACVLPSLLLSLLFAVIIVLSPGIDAQTTTGCLGKIYVRNGTMFQAALSPHSVCHYFVQRAETLARA